MTHPPAVLPEAATVNGPPERSISRDERWIRTIAETLGPAAGPRADRDHEASSAALRALLERGDAPVVRDAARRPR